MELSVIVMLSIIKNVLSIVGAQDGFELDFISKMKFKEINVGEAMLLLGKAKGYAQNQMEISQEMFNIFWENSNSRYLKAYFRHQHKAEFWIALQEELVIAIKNQKLENEIPEIMYA